MPDPNKHDALTHAGFTLQDTCQTCQHWTPTNGSWGHCSLIRYTHAKHSQESRPVGTPAIGLCPQHTPDPVAIYTLAGNDYAERYGDVL